MKNFCKGFVYYYSSPIFQFVCRTIGFGETNLNEEAAGWDVLGGGGLQVRQIITEYLNAKPF